MVLNDAEKIWFLMGLFQHGFADVWSSLTNVNCYVFIYYPVTIQ